MGSTQICLCCHKYGQKMIIYLLILFASTSILTHVGFMAEGRAISELIEAAQKGKKEQHLVMVAKAQIGSTPPKCDKRCRTCGRCEAVQVPVSPQAQVHRRHSTAAKDPRTIAFSRSDDLSNYKPMSWKCKCGDYFFNP